MLGDHDVFIEKNPELARQSGRDQELIQTTGKDRVQAQASRGIENVCGRFASSTIASLVPDGKALGMGNGMTREASRPMFSIVTRTKSALRQLVASRGVEAYWRFWARLVLLVRRPLIIAVTGTVGKTSTVAMIGKVLEHPSAYRRTGWVLHTENNMNDDRGLPMTVLRFEDWMSPRERFAATLLLPFRALSLLLFTRYPDTLVLEYGTHWKGHLHQLVKLAPPEIGVVTTIGPAHLDRLKTVQGVIREKGAVVSATPASGLVVLGAEHDYVAELEALAKAPVRKVRGRGLQLSQEIARVIGLHLGLSEQAISSAIADFRPKEGRLNTLHPGRLTVIDDSYNANPLSMRLALDTLTELANPPQRRVAFLGAMAELGENTVTFHDEIGRYAREKCDVTIGVGELARHYNPDHWFSTSRACAEQIAELVRPGDCLLVKGSASLEMGVIVRRVSELADPREQSRLVSA